MSDRRLVSGSPPLMEVEGNGRCSLETLSSAKAPGIVNVLRVLYCPGPDRCIHFLGLAKVLY